MVWDIPLFGCVELSNTLSSREWLRWRRYGLPHVIWREMPKSRYRGRKHSWCKWTRRNSNQSWCYALEQPQTRMDLTSYISLNRRRRWSQIIIAVLKGCWARLECWQTRDDLLHQWVERAFTGWCTGPESHNHFFSYILGSNIWAKNSGRKKMVQ